MKRSNQFAQGAVIGAVWAVVGTILTINHLRERGRRPAAPKTKKAAKPPKQFIKLNNKVLVMQGTGRA